MDAVGETGAACSASDSMHFENLNGSLGSLAEAQSVSSIVSSPYNLLAGLGVNGAAGVKTGVATSDWPQILGGYGGSVGVDPKSGTTWYVNDQAGVAVYRCSQAAPCTPADFGLSPVITNADVGNDGFAMPAPAPILVDPYDPTQLLIGTCRVWRGPGSGSGWTSSNAISPIFDTSSTTGSCQGDALIRSIAAQAQAGGETIYAGTYGAADGGANLPGHLLGATFNPAGGVPVWSDLTSGAVVNDSLPFNYYGFDISSVGIDPHDASGRRSIARRTAARPGMRSPPTFPTRRPTPSPSIRRMPMSSMWPPTPGSFIPPRLPPARSRFRSAGRCLAQVCRRPRS
jgi:hypothetical protein